MARQNKSFYGNPSGQATGIFTITPHDTTLFAFTSSGVYVGGAGNISVLMSDGSTGIFIAVPVGSLLPIQADRVNATGTTATNLLGLL